MRLASMRLALRTALRKGIKKGIRGPSSSLPLLLGKDIPSSNIIKLSILNLEAKTFVKGSLGHIECD